MGVKYKDCSFTWKEVKKRIAENEGSLVSELKEKWNKHSKNSVSYVQLDPYVPKRSEPKTEEMLSRVISQVRSMKLKNWKHARSAVLQRFSVKNKNVGEKPVFSSLLLWYCLCFLHRGFAAHWDACWLASTRFINDQNKPTFFTLVFRALLCHPPSPPRALPCKNLV